MIDAAYVLSLLLLASSLSGLPVPQGAALPTVERASSAYGQKLVGPSRDGTIALTGMADRRVFVWQDWRPNAFGTCVVVHEMTHVLQSMNHVPFDTTAELEPLAYQTEAKCHEGLGDEAEARRARQMATRFQALLSLLH